MDFQALIDAYIKPYTAELIALAVLVVVFRFALEFYRKTQDRKAEREALRESARVAAIQHEARLKRQRDREIEATEKQRLEAIRRKAEAEKARREEEERQAQQAAIAEQAEMDRLLHEWNEKMRMEETEEEIQESDQHEAQQTEEAEKIAAMDRSLADWELEELGVKPRQSVRKQTNKRQVHSTNVRVLETHKKVKQALEQVEREADDLDYVINKLQTGVDFLPIQVKDTINKWKRGEVYRRNTLGDLKLKFRYEAYSIDDGMELLYMYGDWIVKQRQQLYQFLTTLGTPADEAEDNLLEVIAQAEEAQWGRSLEIDMDILESLKTIRDIHQIMATMELRLRDLDAVCKRRSDQIIAPAWEPKGTL